METIISSIAANIWVLIPVFGIFGVFGTAIVSELAGNKKLKEENEMLKDLLANKERQLNQIIAHNEKLDAIEASLKQLPRKSE